MNVVYAQNLPEYKDAIEVYSDEDIEVKLPGFGNDDFANSDNSDACLPGENFSMWFYIEIHVDADPDIELEMNHE